MYRLPDFHRAGAANSSAGIAIDGGPGPEGGHQCKICGVVIPYASGSIPAHFLSITHQALAREMGVYCSCGRNFLNPANFPYHKCMSPSIRRPEAVSYGFNGCQICGVAFRSQDCLKQHKDSQQHLDRAESLGYRCACVRFFSDLGTMERHQCFDEAMRNQTGSIGNAAPSPPHLNCTGCGDIFLSEEEFFARHKGYEGVHSPVWTRPPKNADAPAISCRVCDVHLYQWKSFKAHKKMQSHIDLCMSKGLYCLSCEKSFNNGASVHTHWLRFHDPSRPTEFRCCDCRENFHTNKLLKKHACRHVPPAGYHACEPCNLRFSSNRERALHLNSKNHKPVKCRGGGGCIRKFKDLPGMLQHLGSGSCISKMNGGTTGALLKKRDTASTTAIKGAGQSLITSSLPPQPSTPRMAAFEEKEMYLHSEDPRGICIDSAPTAPLQCGSSDRPASPQTFTSGKSCGLRGIPTSLSGGISELESRSTDPYVCPVCSKKFKLPGGLASHIASPVHAEISLPERILGKDGNNGG